MIFIGDVHGQVGKLKDILHRCGPGPVVQVGDLGLGFNNITQQTVFPHPRFHFIRGNHDDPHLCQHHPAYLGDYGYNADLGIYVVSGAWSIDYQWRTEWRDWWRDEELSERQGNVALRDYAEVRPRVMVTHDAPHCIIKMLGLGLPGREIIENRTSNLLQLMFELHQPDLWVFGHHHTARDQVIGGTRFVCVATLQRFEADAHSHTS